MPRVTAPDVENNLKIIDAISGETITLYYRLPTPEERVLYNKSLVRRNRNKLENTSAEANQWFGKKILTGIKDGDFAKRVNGEDVLYSSDPQSPAYDPDWKELVCTHASDLVEFLAMTVFGGNSRDMDIFGGETGIGVPGEGISEEDGPKNDF
jgi:hypothetical protein